MKMWLYHRAFYRRFMHTILSSEDWQQYRENQLDVCHLNALRPEEK